MPNFFFFSGTIYSECMKFTLSITGCFLYKCYFSTFYLLSADCVYMFCVVPRAEREICHAQNYDSFIIIQMGCVYYAVGTGFLKLKKS